MNNFVHLLFHSLKCNALNPRPPTPESMLFALKGRIESLKFNIDFGGRGWVYTGGGG